MTPPVPESAAVPSGYPADVRTMAPRHMASVSESEGIRKTHSLLKRVRGAAWRHGLTTFGPVSVSVANFIAALSALHTLGSREFGQFSFLVVLVAFCTNLMTALLGAPLAAIAHVPQSRLRAELDTYFKLSVIFSIIFGAIVFVMAILTGVSGGAALLAGVYGAAMSLRLVARTYSYTQNRVRRVILSDSAYSLSLLFGTWLLAHGRPGLFDVELVFALGTLCAIPLFGGDFCGDLFRALRKGSIWSYGRVWRDLTRWSVLGLVTTEMTVNAHVYLVTFISGSQALALIAAATLFTRPVALVMAALPDREGPALARLLADRDWRKADRNVKEFRVVIATLWLANVVLAVAVLVFIPALVIKKGYDVHTFVAVVAIWLTITAVRGARAPDGLFLLAARAFRPLARASVVSSIVAVTATLALLLIFNPVLSLFGIMAGEIALWFMLHVGVRALKHDLSNHSSRDGEIRSAFVG